MVSETVQILQSQANMKEIVIVFRPPKVKDMELMIDNMRV